jgi:hypothetical protein
MLGGGFGLSDRGDRHSFALEYAVFARIDEKMNMPPERLNL